MNRASYSAAYRAGLGAQQGAGPRTREALGGVQGASVSRGDSSGRLLAVRALPAEPGVKLRLLGCPDLDPTPRGPRTKSPLERALDDGAVLRDPPTNAPCQLPAPRATPQPALDAEPSASAVNPSRVDFVAEATRSDEERVYPYPTAYEAEACEGAAAYIAELDAEFPGLTSDERLEAAWAVVPSLMDPWEPYREPLWLRIARWAVS